MTTDQEAENVAASVKHLMIQRGIDAREWERQAKQWEGVADAQRKELEDLRAAIGREWLHILDTLIEDAKVQYAKVQDMDRRDLCFFWAGKQSVLRYLHTLAEEDAGLVPRAAAALTGAAGEGENK